MIRRAKEKDLPDIAELLKQILMLHHEVRPDIFHTRGSKFSKEQLKEMLIHNQSLSLFMNQTRVKLLPTCFFNYKKNVTYLESHLKLSI